MTCILSLPQDVHLLIRSKLSLADVLRLRQTCSAFCASISQDKQLWAYIFRCDVKSKGLCVPYNLRDIDEVNAHDIESWVKYAIVLNKRYATPYEKLYVRRLGSSHGLAVTWMRLIFGCWCLVASADSDQSQLSLWKIPSQGEIQLATTIYLEAPVINGLVDDSGGRLQCALTIGSSTPHILILSISRCRERAALRQLAEISEASHVRFLKGDVLGFAVKNGDDAYPYIANWQSGEINQLCVPSNTTKISSRLPLEPCITMTAVNDLVFTLHRTAIHVFSYPQERPGSNANHVATMSLSEEIYDGHFSEPFVERGRKRPGVVRAHIQGFDTNLRQVMIIIQYDEEQSPTFTLQEDLKRTPSGIVGTLITSRFCFGPLGRRMFCMSLSLTDPWASWAYSTTSVYSPDYTEKSPSFSTFDEYVPFSGDGLPIPHIVSSLAFDDGNGLLLIGTVTGDVRVGTFISDTIISSSSMHMSLPETTEGVTAATAQRLFHTKVSPDLPIFYTIRKSCKLYSELPPALRVEAIRSWCDLRNGPQPFSEWSNDWSSFECIWDWITPISRFGAIDKDFSNTTPSVQARSRLGALGEIIPVAYDINNHKRVIFRIGERLFYCRSLREDEDDEGWDEFEFDDDDIILGVLPCTYSEFLSDPPSILFHVSQGRARRNLNDNDWVEPPSIVLQQRAAMSVYRLHAYKDILFGGLFDDSIAERWSDEDWRRYHRAAANIGTQF